MQLSQAGDSAGGSTEERCDHRPEAFPGFRGLGFRALGVQGLGFRGLRFRVWALGTIGVPKSEETTIRHW